jgi:hypothetical protein
MKFITLPALLLSLALASTAAAREISSAERAALTGQPPTDVATLRAGASEGIPAVKAAERDGLSRADASATGLDAMRAGDDHDLMIVGVVVIVVVLVILIV